MIADNGINAQLAIETAAESLTKPPKYEKPCIEHKLGARLLGFYRFNSSLSRCSMLYTVVHGKSFAPRRDGIVREGIVSDGIARNGE